MNYPYNFAAIESNEVGYDNILRSAIDFLLLYICYYLYYSRRKQEVIWKKQETFRYYWQKKLPRI